MKPETVRLMQEVASAPGSPQSWGLGWSVDNSRGFRVIRHGGQQLGVDNQFVLYPDQKVVIVVLANQNNWKVRELADDIAAVVVPGFSAGKKQVSAPQPTSSFPNVSGKWAGTVTTYSGSVPFSLTFQPDGDIHVNLAAQYTGLLNQVENYGDALTAKFHGTLPTDEARSHKHGLSLMLRQEGAELIGQLVAEVMSEPSIFALPSFVRLTKAAEGPVSGGRR